MHRVRKILEVQATKTLIMFRLSHMVEGDDVYLIFLFNKEIIIDTTRTM